MKKLLCAVLVLTLVFPLAACFPEPNENVTAFNSWWEENIEGRKLQDAADLYSEMNWTTQEEQLEAVEVYLGVLRPAVRALRRIDSSELSESDKEHYDRQIEVWDTGDLADIEELREKLIALIEEAAGPAGKVFTAEGFAITLDDSFTEVETTRVAAYNSTNNMMAVAVVVEKETFESIETFGLTSDMSLEIYATFGILTEERDSTVEEKDGLTYFTYETGTFSYMAVAYRGADAFWIVRFGSTTENFDSLTDQFFAWAKSVEV
jgi:hypothetical protein